MSELSGGEQQLAGIARALTQQPELLLLDEPTSHLDITHQVQVLNVLQQLNQEMGLTVLMVIHDLNLASEFCDHLVLVNQGRIHTQGTPEEVLTFHNIEDVYQTVVVTQNNPLSGKPAVFLASGKVLKEIQERLSKL
jgi:iron complex transport system ATP-binding protein